MAYTEVSGEHGDVKHIVSSHASSCRLSSSLCFVSEIFPSYIKFPSLEILAVAACPLRSLETRFRVRVYLYPLFLFLLPRLSPPSVQQLIHSAGNRHRFRHNHHRY